MTYGTNAFEAIQTIASDQKDYHKCYSCVIVYWIAKIHQSVTAKILHQPSVPSKITPLYVFSSHITLVKRAYERANF